MVEQFIKIIFLIIMSIKKISLYIVASALILGGIVATVAADDDEGLGRGLEKAISNIEKHLNRLLEVKDHISDHDLKEGRSGTSVLITPAGQARITNGEIVSIASSSATFTVKLWGKEWLVMTNSDTKFVGRGSEVLFGSLIVGHKVDVSGSMMTETGHEGHIMARLVRDRSLFAEVNSARIEELKKKIQELMDRLNLLLQSVGATSTNP